MKLIKTNLPSDQFLHLPSDFQKPIADDLYQISDFEKNFCRVKLAPTNEIKKPVLKNLPKKLTSQARQTFKLIHDISKDLKEADELVNLVKATPDISDEVFVQALMFTTGKKSLIHWKLLLIICSLFVPNKEHSRYLSAYLVRNAIDDWAEIAQLCYIRLMHVTDTGVKPSQIPEQALSGTLKFGITIAEQMFHQRKSHPNLPLPHTLYRIVSVLQLKHCEQSEGVFREPGNKKVVDKLAEELNQDKDELEGSDVTVNDLASLLKKWFGDLPNPPVPFETLDALLMDSGENDFVDFTELLPRANQTSLMFLVGFLRSLLKHADKTRMDSKNLAMCFTPAIVRVADGEDKEKAKSIDKVAPAFVEALIKRWNTDQMYPIKDEFLH
ncbi:Rho-GTPase-activating protein [Tritrichomonas foetus]|uniref:Rho-GTPase-activating protein n=1 Tax=Tritrichomonas foetus TaxID=1144522 RepID=A0A1J4JZ57_9EUKA|nr:Rho-GTPase-activating protein [Tritrichomonas foetus]|eukprot:OHT04455.1 Rho-GTPase-activating protein [Tritrichomonas foetus]